jgi:deoxyribodipyrimidine photo-lyase
MATRPGFIHDGGTMSDRGTAIVWFRRDLRLNDNPALGAACERAQRIVALYVHAPEEDGEWAPGGASRWWLHHSLERLDASLHARGGRLTLRRGDSLATLLTVARESGANRVYWNRLHDPARVAHDTRIKAALREAGLECESFDAGLLHEPREVRTGQGEPYRVFTPFWRACSSRLATLPRPLRAPESIAAPPVPPASLALDELQLRPRIRWDAGLQDAWTPGEDGALAQLDAFVGRALAAYGEGRNRPDRADTSRLSPHLHFGEVGPRQCLVAARNAVAERPAAQASAESFVRELGWREFAHHLLHHFPHTPASPLDARFDAFPWEPNDAWVEAWQRGRTGYPIVDAGMRELWHTGWMHNRVRMIAASLLTKNLRQPWLRGAQWFWDTLVDADLANNTLGWQWTAGCGADAAPFFRIFNPMLQTERFDPERNYLRRWLPELTRLPDKWIHRPWEAPPAVLADAGVALGRDYPRPIVDFRDSRAAALAAYGSIKGPAAAANEGRR